MGISGFVKGIRKAVLPVACPLCGEVLDVGEVYVCGECEGRIQYLKPPLCLRCGGEISSEEEEFCENCKKNQRSFVRGFPAARYDFPMDESLAAFKYHNKRVYGAFFANEIWKVHGKELAQLGLDALIPVPIHERKLKKRGYNQARLLAEQLGKRLRVPVDDELLRRIENTPPQKKLDAVEREINLKRAFQISDKRVNYKRVLLVDDIYTTGATAQACAKCLLESGISEVYCASVCIGGGVR